MSVEGAAGGPGRPRGATLDPSGIGFALVAGGAAGAAAVLVGPAALGLALGLAAALVLLRRPALGLGTLLVLVLLQDALVDGGLGPLRYADEALVLLLLAGAGLRAWRGREPLARARTPLDLPLLAFLVIGAAGAAWNAVPPLVAGLGLLALTKGPLAFLVAAHTPLRRREIARACALLIGLVAAAGVVALLQRAFGEAGHLLTGRGAYWALWQGRKVPGPFSHHNALGHACVLAGALLAGLAVAESEARGGASAAGRPPPRRLAPWLAAAGCGLGLTLSASRESWLATVAAAVALSLGAGSRRVTAAALAGSAALLATGAAIYAGSQALRAEMARRLAGVPAGWRDFELGLTDWAFRGEYRVYALRKSLEILADRPWLGTGPGRYGGAVAQRYGSPVYDAYAFLPLDGVYEPLDLFWARLPAELGLLGAGAYLWMLGVLLAAAIAAQRLRAPLLRGLGLGAAAAFVAALVFAAFSPAFEDPLVAIPLWALGGVLWRARALAPGGPAGEAS